MEIVNNVFRMFYDGEDIERLWKILERITLGPAQDVAEDTLDKLVGNSKNEIDVIRYNHLIEEIERYRCQEMNAQEFEDN